MGGSFFADCGFFVRFLCLALALAVSLEARAWQPTWGAELTFTNDELQRADHGPQATMPRAPENMAALWKFYKVATKALKHRADVASVEYLEEEDKWSNDVVRVTYRDGFHFDVTLDAYCLEVIPHYFTLDELKTKHADRLRTDVFGLMKDAGLEAHPRIGGGHLHVGAESGFGDDVLFFRNFLVDHMNHAELALGGFERDHANAAPFLTFTRQQRRKMADLLARVDRGDFDTVRKLATAFVAEVLFDDLPATGARIMQAKYWQLNVLRMAKLDTWDLEPNETWDDYEAWVLFDDVPKNARTAEWRAMRTQMSVDDLILDVELAEGRMRYLRGLGRPLPLTENFLRGYEPTPEECATDLFRYIVESGVSPAAYRERIPGPLDEVLAWRRWRATYEALIASGCSGVVASGGG